MTLFQDTRLGHRIGGAVALLLLLLALANILSARQTRQLDAKLAELASVTLPSGRLVHELMGLVEDLRGMAALHLVLSGGPELAALEARMQGKRQKLALRLAAFEPRIQDDGDRQHCQIVKASLVDFWREQDKLLALSRLAANDAAAAAAARALLAGPSQLTFQKLVADLDAWWDYHEQRAGQAAQQSHADASRAMSQLAMLGGVGLVLVGVCVALLRRSIRLRPAPAGCDGVPSADTALDVGRLALAACAGAEHGGLVMDQVEATMAALQVDSHRMADIIGNFDGMALQAQLLALNAAVDAARAGTQGPDAARVADEVRRLAQRAGSTAGELQALVSATVDRIAAGRQEVRKVGGTIVEVMAQCRQVSALIGESTPGDRRR